MRIIHTKTEKTYIIFVKKDEAIRLIKSLAHQMMNQDVNTGREEFQTDEDEYFTIAVEKE